MNDAIVRYFCGILGKQCVESCGKIRLVDPHLRLTMAIALLHTAGDRQKS